MADSRRAYLEAMKRIERKLGREYVRAIREALKGAKVGKVEDAVRRGDIDGIIRAAGLTRGKLASLTEELRQAYREAAEGTAAALKIDFDIAAPATARALAERSSYLVTYVMESQKEAIRAVLAAGLGRNPRSLALDIGGRINPLTGRREGGIVGLTPQQARFAQRAREQLLELDPSYFDRKLRDRRFDRAIERAIASGQPLPQRTIDRIIGRYADRLLKHRGDNIGRTETLRALAEGRMESVEQAIADGLIAPENVTQVWKTARDLDVRDSHAAMDGQEKPWGEAFESGHGHLLRFPGDPEAPAEESINCRCFVFYRVDWLAQELQP